MLVKDKDGNFLSMVQARRNLPNATKKELENEAKKIENQAKIQNIQISLMELCDRKQSEAQALILGYKATPLQIERYKDKYERAKAGELMKRLILSSLLNTKSISKLLET